MSQGGKRVSEAEKSLAVEGAVLSLWLVGGKRTLTGIQNLQQIKISQRGGRGGEAHGLYHYGLAHLHIYKKIQMTY